MKLLRILVIVSVLLLASISVVGTGAQSTPNEIVIVEVNESEFPQVTIQFRSLDATGRANQSLLPEDLDVEENSRPMSIESLRATEDGIWVHFVIDAGAGMVGERWNRTRSAILDFVDGQPGMQDGIDKVAVSVVEGADSRLLVDYTTNRDVLIAALDDFSPSGGTNFSAPLSPVADVIKVLDGIPEAADQAKAVFLVTPGLESVVGDDELIEVAQRYGVPVNTVLARAAARIPCAPEQQNSDGTITTPACDERLRDLAIESGGQFSHYVDSSSIRELYANLMAERRQYELTYRSTNGIDGTRQVTVASDSGAQATGEYSVQISPPRILIEAPEEGEVIERRAQEYTDDRSSIPPTTETVVATTVFPDVRLRILRATLIVDGETEDEITNPTNPIELTWNLRGIQELGTNERKIRVRILDELGNEWESQLRNVEVGVIVPAQDTASGVGPGADPAVQATAVADITEGVREELEQEFAGRLPPSIPCLSPEPICSSVERPVRGNPMAAISMGVALLSLVFAGVVWVNRDKAPVRAMRETVSSAVDRLTNRYQRAEARAYLHVIAGDVNVGKELEIYGTTPIGRSQQHAELLFQQDNESSPLSRLHCTIIDEEDHFQLRDEDSANGTYLNGSRLQPLVPEELMDGDEIELARVERGGVRLRFTVVRADDELGDDLRKTKRTRRDAEEGSDEVEEVDRF